MLWKSCSKIIKISRGGKKGGVDRLKQTLKINCKWMVFSPPPPYTSLRSLQYINLSAIVLSLQISDKVDFPCKTTSDRLYRGTGSGASDTQSKQNKNDNIHKQRSSKIMDGYPEKLTVNSFIKINIKLKNQEKKVCRI